MRTPEETEALLDKLESLLGDVDSANDRFNRDNWRSNHEEFFEPFQDKLHRLNGDDFDISDATYDEYHSKAKGMGLSEDDYLNSWKTKAEEIFARIWPEAPEEVKEEAAEEIAEEVAEVTDEPPVEESETVVATTDPDVAEEVADVVDEEDITSDEKAKEDITPVDERHPGRDGKKFWDNPSESGGRQGKSGLPSDEKAKEDPFDTWKKGVEEDAARLRKFDRNRK